MTLWCGGSVHWQLCGKAKLERAFQWYKLIPGQVVENAGFKNLWDLNLPYNRMVDARRPDIIFYDKQAKEAKVIDMALPGNSRVKDKKLEKTEKYQLLCEKIGKVWKMKKVTVVPIVIGAFAAVSDMFKK